MNSTWEDLDATRTHARRDAKEIYIHAAPLLQRKEVSLEHELSTPLKLRKLGDTPVALPK